MSSTNKRSTGVVATFKKGLKYNNYFALQQKNGARGIWRAEAQEKNGFG